MGETKGAQKRAKLNVDENLKLSSPSRDLLESLAVTCSKIPSPDNTFQYAFALAKSDNPKELNYAVQILDGLVKENYEHQLDCMYGAAIAQYSLQRYDDARARCEAILRSHPDNRLAAELHLACIQGEEELKDKQLKRSILEGTVGVAAIGLASVAGMMLLGGGRRK
jgi:fission 1 protein